MDPFAYNKNLPNFNTPSETSLKVDIDDSKGSGPLLNNGDNDPTLFAIFDAPEHTLNNLNVFGPNELPLSSQEPMIKNEDFDSSYCTVTRSNAILDDKDLLLTDFDNSSSSPNSQSSKHLNMSNGGFNNSTEYECSSLDNLSFEDMIANGTMAESTPPPLNGNLLECHTDAVDCSPSRVSNPSFLIKSPTTQIQSTKKSPMKEKPFKIQKPKFYQNNNEGLQSFLSSCNMELNYILLSEGSSNKRIDEKIREKCDNNNNNNNNTNNHINNNNDTNKRTNNHIQGHEYQAHNLNEVVPTDIMPSQTIPVQAMGKGQPNIQSIPTEASNSLPIGNRNMESELNTKSFNSSYESIATTTAATSANDSMEYRQPKMNNGKIPRSKRTKCLKKDSTVSMGAKLEYFYRVIQNAKANHLRGIFLRDHAASELAIGKDDYKPLELNLTNIDCISQTLELMKKHRPESFRTIWKIFRQQFDHEVYLTFQLSDEYAAINENEMEISIFTLMVPGHSHKNLLTGCQYLQLVNFILGKNYNHLINDNLAETTVGSDGKMISTQKHHASRVRSHVKKYLKRHVVKDIKRYTEEERSNVSEFHYQMTLHNLVMGCTLKKPFESKVSVALMELPNVKDALIKQSEFFVFKKI